MTRPDYVSEARDAFLAAAGDLHDQWTSRAVDMFALLVLVKGDVCTATDVQHVWAVAGINPDPRVLELAELIAAGVRAAARGQGKDGDAE